MMSTAPTASTTTSSTTLPAIGTFFTSVRRVQQLTPHVRRITFGGGDLDTLQWLGPDQFFSVLLPPLGSTEMSIDRAFTWEQVRALPLALQPRGAYYTLRHHRRDVHEVDVDVVLHGSEIETPASASTWAASARPGDVAALWGPRTCWEPPVDTTWYLLVADETGLPAVGAILDHLPVDATVRVIAEVADRGEQQSLNIGPDVHVTWVHRDGAAAGTTRLLAQHVRAQSSAGGWPTGPVYAWGGAESREMTEVRRFLRDDVGLGREQVSITGYWRRESTG